MKLCNICGEEKNITYFGKRSSSKDGLCNHCKECENSRFRRRYYQNKEKENIRKNKYYHNNKEVVRNHHSLWRTLENDR